MSEYPAKYKWQSVTKAVAYRKSRAAAGCKRVVKEDKILAGWLDGLTQPAAVLDCPCGTGRFISLITSRGHGYTGADISTAMTEEAQKNSSGVSDRFVQADAENLPFPDDSFDCVVIWRLFHHIIDPAVRLNILREASRVSRHKVLISFYHPWSFTYLRLCIKNRFSRKKGIRIRGAFTHWKLKREAESCGLEVAETKSYQKFVSINWFACLLKKQR